MLDTNTVSYLMRGHADVARRVSATPMAALCISAITEGELLFGLARRPLATRLHHAVREFRLRIDVLDWNSAAAEVYGTMRAGLTASGTTIGPLDLLIAAHALASDSVLVTSDRVFQRNRRTCR